MNGNIIGFLIFILNALDAIFTKMFICGISSLEENPLVRAMIDNWPEGWIYVKIFMGLLIWLIFYLRWKSSDGLIIRIGGYAVLSAYIAINIVHTTNIFF